jgi:hypothetical protein
VFAYARWFGGGFGEERAWQSIRVAPKKHVTRDTKLPKKNVHFLDIQIPQALPLPGQRGNVPIEKTLENLKEEFVSILMVSDYCTSQF